MINRYLKFNKEPVVKRVFKGAIKAAKLTLTAGLLFSSSMGLVSGAQEIYEEATSKNVLVDIDFGFGSVVLKNKDTRTKEELFADIEKAVFQVKGIDRAFDRNVTFTKEEKEALIAKIVFAINKEANITTNKFIITDLNKDSGLKETNGLYVGLNTKLFTFTSENIFLDSGLLEELTMDQLITTTIHEMIHAVEYENIMRSSQISKFDKQVYLHTTGNRLDYFSSFAEINPTLLSAQITYKLKEQFYVPSNDAGFEEEIGRDYQEYIFKELLYNLYGVDTSEGTIQHKDLQKLMKGIMENTNGYQFLTIDELIITGLQQKLDNLNINYENQDLKESYYYKSLTSYLDEDILKVRFMDYENKNYAPQYESVKEELERFKEEEGSLFNRSVYNTAFTAKLNEYLNIFRYQVEGYSQDELGLLSNTIMDYARYVDEDNAEKFGFYNVEEIIENSTTQQITNQQIELEP